MAQHREIKDECKSEARRDTAAKIRTVLGGIKVEVKTVDHMKKLD